VSPTYAAEISHRAAAWGSTGCCARAPACCHGILNGIDDAVWNPSADPLIVADFRYDPTLAGRAANKAALQAWFGLEATAGRAAVRGDQPADLAEGDGPAAGRPRPVLLGLGAQLGRGGRGEAGSRRVSARRRRRIRGAIGCVIGYDEALAHQIQAGADALLVPSRFEPCGLTQLCALRYGAVPVVARVGGLADTVIDANEAALAAGVRDRRAVRANGHRRRCLEAALRRTVDPLYP
jgi:starch synthase